MGRDRVFDISMVDFVKRDETSILYRENRAYDSNGKPHILPPLITDDHNIYTGFTMQLKTDLDIFVSPCIADPI